MSHRVLISESKAAGIPFNSFCPYYFRCVTFGYIIHFATAILIMEEWLLKSPRQTNNNADRSQTWCEWGRGRVAEIQMPNSLAYSLFQPEGAESAPSHRGSITHLLHCAVDHFSSMNEFSWSKF